MSETLVRRMRSTAGRMRDTIMAANKDKKRLTVDEMIMTKMNLDYLINGIEVIEKIIVEGE